MFLPGCHLCNQNSVATGENALGPTFDVHPYPGAAAGSLAGNAEAPLNLIYEARP
jgi:hypothetical protein